MKITMTQTGQPKPYADSVYAGTIEAGSEQEAREALQKMRGASRPIYDKQDKDHWSSPYFVEFQQIREGQWKFKIIEEYTG